MRGNVEICKVKNVIINFTRKYFFKMYLQYKKIICVNNFVID